MDVFVGFGKELEAIKEQLVYGSSRDVVSLVGMGGIGKSTLAKKLYADTSIVNHFHVRAWCAISQVYQKQELLLEILRDVIGHTDNVPGKTEEDLAFELYKSLKGRRYLIVIDDIWDIEAWNALKRSFPDDNNGSRIIITSRIIDVPSEGKLGAKTYPHHLGLLEKDESWELLHKKIFPHENCPPELVVVGKKIADLCGGLPLALVVIAGVLAGMAKQRNMWEKVEESISDHISNDPTQCMNILELSYKHLPDHLTSCFLYFGAFPEDRKISALKLKRLWIAEGFIQGDENDNLEDIAESYLNDLVNRSLLIASKTRSKWRAKILSIHDLIRDLCLEKAKEADFFKVIDKDHDSLPTQRRLIFHSEFDFAAWKTCSQYVSSVLCFRKNVNVIDFCDISNRTKLLNVLDLDRSELSSRGIELQVHLRYLVVGRISTGIPSSIGTLLNLQFFCVGSGYEDLEIPDSIWKLERLICVEIGQKVRFAPLKDTPESCSQLLSLQSLSKLYVCYGDQTEKILRRLPNLKKLSCILGESCDPSNKCNRFPLLDFLSKLQSLELSCESGSREYPYQLDLPLNLKKLKLSRFHFPWNQISQIARLPNLEVLKLESKALAGEEWELEEGDFPKLRYLKLYEISFSRWSVSDDDFPCLERLVLEHCYDLEEIPASFGDINTLETIEISCCTQSVSLSAYLIQEDKLEMGNEMFGVYVTQELQPQGDKVERFMGHRYDGSLSSVVAVACSPTDATLVASGGYDDIFLWRIGEQDSRFQLLVDYFSDKETQAVSLAFSTDGLLLASTGSGSRILIWDISSRNLKCKLQGPGIIESVSWHPKRHIVSAVGLGGDASVWMWDADNGALLATFSTDDNTDLGTCTAFIADGKMMCTCFYGGTISVWDLQSHEIIHDVKVVTHEGRWQLNRMAVSPDSSHALCGTSDGNVYMVDLTNGKVVTPPTAHAERVTCVGFSLSYPLAATGGEDGKIIIWDLEPFQPRCVCEYEDMINALSWLVGSTYLATGSEDGMVHIWDAISGECVTTFSDHSKSVHYFPYFSKAVNCLSLSADGDFLVSGGDGGISYVFDITEFK